MLRMFWKRVEKHVGEHLWSALLILAVTLLLVEILLELALRSVALLGG